MDVTVVTTQTYHKSKVCKLYARHTTSLYLQRHGTSMGTKAAVSFANIFIAEIETQILQQSKHKPPEWIRYIDDIASLWVTTKDEVLQFIQKAFLTNSTQKSNLRLKYQKVGKATFLDCTTIYKGERFKETGILDVRTHFKPTVKFKYKYFKSSHPPGVKNSFIKGEALKLLITNSSRTNFEEQIKNFKTRLQTRGYQETQINNTLAEVNFNNRSAALQQKLKTRNKILHLLPNTTQRHQTLKEILLKNCYLIQNQPELNVIFPQPPIVSYKKAQSLKDMLVRAKLLRHLNYNKSGTNRK